MRLSINDDCGFDKMGRKATDALLKLLKEHHDYNLPSFVTKAQVIEIRGEPDPETPIDICILPVAETKLTVNSIKHVVCRHFGISHNDMVSPRRDAKYHGPRMVAMYLARELTTHGLPSLGKFFQRDHTSVLHNIRKMEGMMGKDTPLVRDVSYLREVLGA